MKLSSPKKHNKAFKNFLVPPKTGCLTSLYHLLIAQTSSFLFFCDLWDAMLRQRSPLSFYVLWLMGHHAWAAFMIYWLLKHPFFYFISFFCDLRNAMLRQRSPVSFHVLWLMGRHATPEVTTHISHVIRTQKRRFLYGWQVSQGCTSTHILSLLANSLINNCRLRFICVKIMNVSTCGEEVSKLAV